MIILIFYSLMCCLNCTISCVIFIIQYICTLHFKNGGSDNPNNALCKHYKKIKNRILMLVIEGLKIPPVLGSIAHFVLLPGKA